MFDSAEADYDKRLQQSKDQYKKAFVQLQKEQHDTQASYDKQIADMKAQCEDDHTVASLRKEEEHTDARLKSEEMETSSSILHLKVHALEQELAISKDSIATKDQKIVELQRQQTNENESCNQQIKSLKKDLDDVRRDSMQATGDSERMKQAVHSHEQTIAEKDSIITSLQKQVSDSR